MKNIQVIDGAVNCAFGIFQATEAEFALIFPAVGHFPATKREGDRDLGSLSEAQRRLYRQTA